MSSNEIKVSNKEETTTTTTMKTPSSNHQETDEAMTCSVLCSLGGGVAVQAAPPSSSSSIVDNDNISDNKKRKIDDMSSACPCPKQMQLPMFLSKTYHMIDKCDSEIATWSEAGDNFVVKNVEKFASNVLPLYFKHSNFSSFARQLNFYGFRKLRTDPILTSEVDPCTACYVRFYHENFQRDKPELLQYIKRATKGEQQSKDDLDTLRKELQQLRDTIRTITSDYDRKLAELSYECNRRISSMNAEYDKLAALVHGAITARLPSLSTGGSATAGGPTAATLQVPVNANLLHSLSQAAVTIQSVPMVNDTTNAAAVAAAAAAAASNTTGNNNNSNQHPATDSEPTNIANV